MLLEKSIIIEIAFYWGCFCMVLCKTIQWYTTTILAGSKIISVLMIPKMTSIYVTTFAIFHNHYVSIHISKTCIIWLMISHYWTCFKKPSESLYPTVSANSILYCMYFMSCVFSEVDINLAKCFRCFSLEFYTNKKYIIQNISQPMKPFEIALCQHSMR